MIDMSTHGDGEWRRWNNASFIGAKFLWTSLHNFGSTDGTKGDLWLESARQWGKSCDDCPSVVLNDTDCEHFFEWNARTQITTWNPTSKQSGSIPDGPSDYVSKHWSGLIKDYYGGRASLLLQQALADYNAGHMLSRTELARLYAVHAYKWTTDIYKYPTEPTEMCWPYRRVFDKYKQWFALCVASLEINGADINDA